MAEKPAGPSGYVAKRDFTTSPVLAQFIGDRSFVTGIKGPLGSGKSVGCCCKLMMLAMQQPVGPGQVRRSRWAVIRNTYPELSTTTLNTWLEVFPEQNCGPVTRGHPIVHHIRRDPVIIEVNGKPQLQPGIDCEVLFLALDKPQDVKHLKSLELTGAWINEACEIPPEIIDMMTGRVGRYPPADEEGCAWAGIFMDTNADDDTNWWYKAAELGEGIKATIELETGEVVNINWTFYAQPPAVLECKPISADIYEISEPGFERRQIEERYVVPGAGAFWAINPAAENLAHLRPGYYHQQIQRKVKTWIQRYLQARYIYMVDGAPWVPEYNDEIMAMKLKASRDIPLIGGMDIGGGTLQPAAVIGQRGPYGDIRNLVELCCFDMGLDRFSTLLHQTIKAEFPGMAMPDFTIDPAASKRDEIWETAIQSHLQRKGFSVQLAPTNDPIIRREALALPMGRLINVGGRALPAYQVDREKCPTLRAGLAGKWFKRRMAMRGDRFAEKPEKNQWSHICEASGYMCLGAGEHRVMTQGADPQNMNPRGHSWDQSGTAVMVTDFDVFNS